MAEAVASRSIEAVIFSTEASKSMASGPSAYLGRAIPIRCCAKSAYICQGRVAFALANLLREIVLQRKPM